MLIEKMRIFADEIATRDRVAKHYSERLAEAAIVPTVPESVTSIWAQYTLRLPDFDRGPSSRR